MTRHTRTYKVPSKSCQTQSMPLGRACRRTKVTWLIRRPKYSVPQRSTLAVHTAPRGQQWTSNPAPAHGPYQQARGSADHKSAKGPGIHPDRKTPESAGEPPLCLFGVPRGFPVRRSPNPCLRPRTAAPNANQCPAPSQPNHPKYVRTRHTRTHNVPAELRQRQTT